MRHALSIQSTLPIMDAAAPTNKPRVKPRKLMRVYDAGPGETDDGVIVSFECPRCKYRSEWTQMRTVTEAKRGIPCPFCNKEAEQRP